MADGDKDKDSKNTADLFVAARIEDIGTIAEPKAGPAMQEFVDDHILSTAPFQNIVIYATSYNNLLQRLQAFKRIPGYAALCIEISAKANAGIDKKSAEPIRIWFFDCLREIRTMSAMLEAALSQGPAINPDGHFRACGAAPNSIRLNVGGLASYLSHGEPTPVSLQVVALAAIRLQSAPTNNATGINGNCPTNNNNAGTNNNNSNAGDNNGGGNKRPAQGRTDNGQPNPQQRNITCNYCGKIAHNAAECRQRLRDDRHRNNGNNNNNNNNGYNANNGNGNNNGNNNNNANNNYGQQGNNAPPNNMAPLDPNILRSLLEKFLKEAK